MLPVSLFESGDPNYREASAGTGSGLCANIETFIEDYFCAYRHGKPNNVSFSYPFSQTLVDEADSTFEAWGFCRTQAELYRWNNGSEPDLPVFCRILIALPNLSEVRGINVEPNKQFIDCINSHSKLRRFDVSGTHDLDFRDIASLRKMRVKEWNLVDGDDCSVRNSVHGFNAAVDVGLAVRCLRLGYRSLGQKSLDPGLPSRLHFRPGLIEKITIQSRVCNGYDTIEEADILIGNIMTAIESLGCSESGGLRLPSLEFSLSGLLSEPAVQLPHMPTVFWDVVGLERFTIEYFQGKINHWNGVDDHCYRPHTGWKITDLEVSFGMEELEKRLIQPIDFDDSQHIKSLGIIFSGTELTPETIVSMPRMHSKELLLKSSVEQISELFWLPSQPAILGDQ
jgi:hypothetical protein